MITGLIGLFFGFLSGVFLLVGLLPFLGWLNWFTRCRWLVSEWS